jgi:hypothetical protein
VRSEARAAPRRAAWRRTLRGVRGHGDDGVLDALVGNVAGKVARVRKQQCVGAVRLRCAGAQQFGQAILVVGLQLRNARGCALKRPPVRGQHQGGVRQVRHAL